MTSTTEHDDNAVMNDAIRGKAGHGQQADEPDEQAEQAVPSFDGGAREAAPKPKDMNQLIRQATGYGR